MAQGVSGYFDVDTNVSWADVRVYYNQEYNISTNSSVVSITGIAVKSTSYALSWYLDGKILIDGEDDVSCSSVGGTQGGVNVTKTNEWVNASFSSKGGVTVKHNEDGTASATISFGVYNYSNFKFYNGSHSHPFDVKKGTSRTITLTTIPRTSAIVSAQNATLGEKCSLTWTPNSGSFYYKLKFSLGSWSATTSAIHPNTTSQYTYDGYTYPIEVAKQITNKTSGTMNVTLYTYSDSACATQVGNASTSYLIQVPEYVIPTVESISVSLDNSENDVVNGWGIAVAGFTKVYIEASASGIYDSTINSFTVSGATSATVYSDSLSYTSDIITYSGDKTFSVTCKDSRSRSSDPVSSNAITFYPYAKPNVLDLVVSRNSNDSSKVTAKATWEFSSVNGKNSASGILYYQKRGSSSWQTYGEIKNGVETQLNATFGDASSYDFKVVVTDALSMSADSDNTIATLSVLMDFPPGGKGLGIGKICESDALEVQFDAKFFGSVYIGDLTLEEYIKSIINSST